MISDCSRITYENALLGDTMISKLQAKGSELEKENEAAVKRMEEEAFPS